MREAKLSGGRSRCEKKGKGTGKYRESIRRIKAGRGGRSTESSFAARR